MRNVIALVLGGGRGTRLSPLTQHRSKPAVPLAGKYRLIDIPLSNCIHSGIDRIYVMTQFNSVSLHRHIAQTYSFDAFRGGFVGLLAAQQTNEGDDWYQGTADAVRQHIRYIQQRNITHVLILSGDQLYRMDYAPMLATHEQSGADVTIASVPVHRRDASELGIMRVDDTGRVSGFLEKPKTEEDLEMIVTDPAWIDQHGVESHGRDCLASMGIYLFNRDALVDVLTKTDYQDFGREVFPASIRARHVQIHLFDGYWEDIGTIRSFYEANLELADSNPPFQLASEPSIFSRPRFLPPSRMDGATIKRSLLADGCVIDAGAVIENSVIGLRCRIGKDVTIRNSVIMGNDSYDTPEEIRARRAEGRPSIGIGEGTVIDGAIVDKNCSIGRNVRLVNHQGTEHQGDLGEVVVRDGIIVVPKGSELPDQWKL
jgi:glucose-1-phosphate adenylyltransferase